MNCLNLNENRSYHQVFMRQLYLSDQTKKLKNLNKITLQRNNKLAWKAFNTVSFLQDGVHM